jgi:predicted transcriptional regulator
MKISEKKREKISEQILAFLYSISPRPVFTFNIAQEIARDEEFVKKMLLKMKSQNLVLEIKKNPKGVPYARRSRWKLSDAAYTIYRQNQHTNS